MGPPRRPTHHDRLTRAFATASHAVAVVAMLSTCVLTWGTVSEGNGTEVRHGWDFSYTDQVVGIDRAWVPMLAAAVLLAVARRRTLRVASLESLAGPILAFAVAGFVMVDSLGVVDALMPGRATVRYRSEVVSLSLGPWVALGGALLGAASVLLRRRCDGVMTSRAAEPSSMIEPERPQAPWRLR